MRKPRRRRLWYWINSSAGLYCGSSQNCSAFSRAYNKGASDRTSYTKANCWDAPLSTTRINRSRSWRTGQVWSTAVPAHYRRDARSLLRMDCARVPSPSAAAPEIGAINLGTTVPVSRRANGTARAATRKQKALRTMTKAVRCTSRVACLSSELT